MKKLIISILLCSACLNSYALTKAEKEQVDKAISSIVKSVDENANKKSYLKQMSAHKITVEQDTKDSTNQYGTVKISIFFRKESASNIEKAKVMVESILDKYKQDTKQDPVFSVSVSLYSDTRIDNVKHYFARVKYLPMIDPLIRIDQKDYLVDISK